MAKHSINENYNGQTKLRHWWIVIRDNLSNLLGWYNSHIDGTADRHRAEDIDYDDSGTVKEKINKIDMSLFKQTNKLPDEILTPGFYYGGGVVNGTLGGSGTYWFAIEIYPVFTNLLQILHQNVNGEWTTYYRNVSGLESDTPQFTEWVRLAKISDVTALRTEVINQIGNTQNLTTVEKENLVNAINEVNQNISNEVNARVNADETIRKEIPIKTTETITSETTDNSSYVTPLVVKNAISNLVESSDEIKNIADGLAQKADKVTNGGFIAGGAKAGKVGSISIGSGISSTGAYGVVIGSGAEGASNCVAIGSTTTAGADKSVAIGYGAESLAQNAVQICEGSNSESESLQFRKYKIVRYDTTDDEYYLKDVGRLSRLYTTNRSNIVEAINELDNEAENNTTELLSKITEQNNSLIMLIQMLANTGINIVPLLEMLGNTITVISDTVTQMYQYSDNNNPDNKLKGIVYAPNLETVEPRSIDDNSGMTTIIMPKVKTIKSQGFWASYGLKTVFIPNACTSLATNAFSVCGNLTNIYIDNVEGTFGDIAADSSLPNLKVTYLKK